MSISLDVLLVCLSSSVGWVVALSLFPTLKEYCGLMIIGTLSLVLGLSAIDLEMLVSVREKGFPFELGEWLRACIIQCYKALMLVLPVLFAAEMFPISGRLIDLARGAQQAEQISPFSQERVSMLEQAMELLFPVFFFTGGGFKLFFQAGIELFNSGNLLREPCSHYLCIPPNTWEEEVMMLARLSSESLGQGVIAAWPVLLWGAVVEIITGIVCRMSSVTTVDFLSWRLMAGLVWLGLGGVVILGDVAGRYGDMIVSAYQTLFQIG